VKKALPEVVMVMDAGSTSLTVVAVDREGNVQPSFCTLFVLPFQNLSLYGGGLALRSISPTSQANSRSKLEITIEKS